MKGDTEQTVCLERRFYFSSIPVFVYEGVEGHSVLPAGGEVCDVDVWVSVK